MNTRILPPPSNNSKFDRIQSNNGKSKPRIQFIDLAKGICILLVILVHSNICSSWGLPEGDIPNFGALRMPLYFVLSGLFFRDYGTLWIFIEKKTNKILIPFIFWYIVSFTIIYLANKFLRNGEVHFSRITDVFIGRDFINIALWFLLCLFWTNCIFAILKKIIPNRTIFAITILSIGFSGVFLSDNGIYLPFFLDSALTAMPFFYFGFILGRTPILYPNRFDRWNLPIGLTLVALSYALFLWVGDNQILYRDNIVKGNWAIAYVNSVLIVSGVLFICKAIGHLPVVSYIGRYSIIVLCIHWLILANLSEVIMIFMGIEIHPIFNLLCTILITTLLIPVCRMYLGAFTAQKDLLAFSKRQA